MTRFRRLVCACGHWKSAEFGELVVPELHQEASNHVREAHDGLAGYIGTEKYDKDPLGRPTWPMPEPKIRP